MSRLLLRALDGFWFEEAPAARPALLRILLGGYVLYYQARRYRMYMKVARSDPSLFRPVGVVSGLEKPVSVGAFRALLLATFAANVAFVLGWRHRHTGPLFAGLLLWVISYRNSWSFIHHSNNVFVLHALILGLTPSADDLSVDALLGEAGAPPEPDWRYGWPAKLMSTVTALTYFLAGVAKVKGPLGWGWAGGEALRSQIAVDGMRKEMLGGKAAPLAYALYDRLLLFKAIGVGSLVLELAAPAALFSKRLSRLWAAGALQMHWGIYLLMKIRFRYQMLGLIFASFFDLERVLTPLGLRNMKPSGVVRESSASLVRGGKGLAGGLSVLMIGAVLWPIAQNWRKQPRDSFPLSYYPMFSLKRKDSKTVRYLVGVDSRGERHLLSHRYAGTGGLNQVRRQINKVVHGGKADALCRIVAANVAEKNEERFADVVTVQVVTGRYRLADFFAGNREPVRERVEASCQVERDLRVVAKDSA